MSRLSKGAWPRAPAGPEASSRCNRNKPAASYRRKTRGHIGRVGEPILRPRIGGVRIPSQFPKTEDIPIEEGDFADKLGPFPGVEFWNNDPSGATVIKRQRFVLPFVRDQDVIIQTR